MVADMDTQKKQYLDPEDLRVMQLAEALADAIWDMVGAWDKFAKWTVGKQLTEAADSIGANIAEAHGRGHHREVINFLLFSRGSLHETRFWLRRAVKRQLIDVETFQSLAQLLTALKPQLNAFITAKRKQIAEGDGSRG